MVESPGSFLSYVTRPRGEIYNQICIDVITVWNQLHILGARY